MAQQTDSIGLSLRQGFAHETLTVTNASLPLTATVYAPAASTQTTGKAQRALITANDQPIRFRYDGGAPTVAIGHKLGIGESIVITGYVNITNFRAIKEGATDCNMAVTYER